MVTPEGNKYLENIDILEITESHDCISVRNIATKNINLEIGGIKLSLFDYLYDLKSLLNCRFEFKFNSKKLETVIAIISPSGFIFALVLIQ